ncbi:MAG: MerR family transcriptional regulator, partial [Anaerolineales bacterium]|nr:MerR family transcriptional regulator [Anaerolineales bacterium]
MSKKKATERASKASRKTPKFQPEATRTAGLITPRQAADILSISTRTLGRWAVAYEKSLSATARRKGRKRFFTGADMNVFQEAAQKMDQGLEIKDISGMLTLVDPNAEAQRSAMVLSTEVALVVGQTKQIAQQMVDEITILRKDNEHQKETNTIQQTIIERLNARLAAVE